MYLTIELIDGRWYVCSTGVRVASLGNLSAKANGEEARYVARETLAGMVNDAAVIREPKDSSLTHESVASEFSTLNERPEQERSAEELDALRESEARHRAAIRDASERSVILSRLTPDHLTALRRFADNHGATWKARLRAAWEAGTLTNYTSADDAELLQQVRNIIGPSGLSALTL